jgi:isocitrate dehydrogenase (NAD+)
LIPGDGVGAELTESVKDIFQAAKLPIEWEQYNVSGYPDKADTGLTKAATDSLKRNKVGLKGILFTPIARYGHQSLNVALRQELDIFAALSHIKGLPGVPTRYKDIDFAIIRENTEGEYSGLEHSVRRM